MTIDHLDLRSAKERRRKRPIQPKLRPFAIGTSHPGPRPSEIDAVGGLSLRKQLGGPARVVKMC